MHSVAAAPKHIPLHTHEDIKYNVESVDRSIFRVQGLKACPAQDLLDAFNGPERELDFCLPGFLAGSVGGCIARGGAGKSFFAAGVAILLTSGVDLMGLGQYPTGRVLYIAAEDPWPAIRKRLKAMGKLLTKTDKGKVCERLDMRALCGVPINITHPAWTNSIIDAAQGARLIIIDTLRRVHDLDENDAGAMAGLINVLEYIAQKTGAAVLFIHHANKASYSGAEHQSAARGSSVLVDNTRWQSYLAPMSDAEAKAYNADSVESQYLVRWGVSKQNFGAPIRPIWLRRGEGGILRPAEVEEKRTAKKEKRRARREF